MSEIEVDQSFEEIIASSRHSAVDNLLDNFHIAAATANLKGYFGCFDVAGVFLGTDATEYWTVKVYLNIHF